MIKKILSSFATIPLLFFFLQLPEGIAGTIETILEKQFEKQPVAAIVLFFPVFCIASTLSSAMTFAALNRLVNGNRPSFNAVWGDVYPKLGKLVLASLLVGLVFVLGFCAMVVPAFYFMALYLFVPQLIMSEPNCKLSVYLFRSTRLAKTNLVTCISTVTATIAIGILTYLLSQTLGTWAGGFSEDNAARTMIVCGIDIFLSMFTGIFVDLWIAHLFLKLKTQ